MFGRRLSTLLTPTRGILAGAAASALGVAIAGMAPVVGTAPSSTVRFPQTVGGGLVLAGWALLVWSIHRFGRESGG